MLAPEMKTNSPRDSRGHMDDDFVPKSVQVELAKESRKRARSRRFDQLLLQGSSNRRLDIGAEIGAGSFGETRVFEAVDRETGAVVAVKVLPKKSFLPELVRREATLHASLGSRCPYIVPLLHFVEKGDSFQLTMPKAQCDLFELITNTITKTGKALAEDASRAILIQLLLALKYLHRRRIAHRDIKPENILIYPPRSPRGVHVQICDFGSAKAWEDGRHAAFFVGPSLEDHAPGTIEYCGPEIFQSNETKPYDERTDLWSLGVVLFVMLGGYTPFTGDNPTQLQQQALRDERINFDLPPHKEFWMDVSQDAKDLIHKLLNPDPRKRISINRAMRHPWLRGEVQEFMKTAMSHVDKNNTRRGSSAPPSGLDLAAFREEVEFNEDDHYLYDNALMLFDDRYSHGRRSLNRRASRGRDMWSPDGRRKSVAGDRFRGPHWHSEDDRFSVRPHSLAMDGHPVGKRDSGRRRSSYQHIDRRQHSFDTPMRQLYDGTHYSPPRRLKLDVDEDVEDCRCCIQ